MDQKKRIKNHQQVFTAFKHYLSIDDLNTIANEIQYEKQLSQQQLLPQVIAKLGADANHKLIDYFTYPAEHHISWQQNRDDAQYNDISTRLAGYYISQNPSQLSANAIIQRLHGMMDKPFEPGETIDYNYGNPKNPSLIREWYFFPKSDDCLSLLMQHLDFSGAKEFLLTIYSGEFNEILDQGEDAYNRYVHSSDCFFRRNYSALDTFSEWLFAQDEFSYEFFQQAARLFPSHVQDRRLFANLVTDEEDYTDNEDQNSQFIAVYQQYIAKLAEELSQNLPTDKELFEALFGYTDFHGIHWLSRGLEKLHQLKLKPKDLKDYGEYHKSIKRLIAMHGFLKDEAEDDLVTALKSFDHQTLQTALPHTKAAQATILKVLDWQQVLPLHKMLFDIAGSSDIHNCEDPKCGVVDRHRLVTVLAACDGKLRDKYFKAISASNLNIKNTIMLLKAAADVDREKVEKKLVRHGQAAIKAYGLYSFQSPEELRARYLKFKEMHKEASQYGPERQANTRAAVQAGLANLAQTAAYPDVVRMEWALEADLADNMMPLDESQNVGDWSITLTLQGITPRIVVTKGDKQLKSVPPKVRQHDSYKAMRESQDLIRSQARRFRGSLEDMMCSGEKIPSEELTTLNRLPVVRGMLTQLIMCTEAGDFGMYSGDAQTLQSLTGETIEIDGLLQLAHPYHLFSADALPQWQRYIVANQIVQPFKQAFRELYVITPAEIESVDVSRRFCGHVVDSAIASRLLQSRGWTLYSDDVAGVYKWFSTHQYECNLCSAPLI